MRARLALFTLWLASTGCRDAPPWRHGPLTLGPAPVVLRPERPLVPGRAGTGFCVGLPPDVWGPPAPAQTAWPDAGRAGIRPVRTAWPEPQDGGIRLASGEVIHVRAVLHSADPSVRAPDVVPGFSGPHARPDEICFGGPITQDDPDVAAIELSATRPLPITYVSWKPWAWASL